MSKLEKVLTEDTEKPVIEVTMEQAEAADALDPTTVEKVHDPKEVEQQLIEEEKKKILEGSDPEETACMALKFYTPIFNNIVDGLSNRELRRVLKGLTEYPFGKNYSGRSEKEKQALQIGQFLQDSKAVLLVKTYSDHAEQILEDAAKANIATANLEIKEEVTFGDKAEMEEKESASNG